MGEFSMYNILSSYAYSDKYMKISICLHTWSSYAAQNILEAEAMKWSSKIQTKCRIKFLVTCSCCMPTKTLQPCILAIITTVARQCYYYFTVLWSDCTACITVVQIWYIGKASNHTARLHRDIYLSYYMLQTHTKEGTYFLGAIIKGL